jgi:peptidoglycan/LPS O-acetylase OafA/YrhL
MPHFLMGAVAGLFLAHRGQRDLAAGSGRGGWLLEASVWITAALILIVLSTSLDERFSIPFGRYNLPWVPVLITWLIVAAPRTVLARAVLEAPPLRWLGVVSYGVYVYHYLALQAAARLLRMAGADISDYWLLFGVASLIVTIVIAGASHRWLEAPIMRRRQANPPAASAR